MNLQPKKIQSRSCNAASVGFIFAGVRKPEFLRSVAYPCESSIQISFLFSKLRFLLCFNGASPGGEEIMSLFACSSFNILLQWDRNFFVTEKRSL